MKKIAIILVLLGVIGGIFIIKTHKKTVSISLEAAKNIRNSQVSNNNEAEQTQNSQYEKIISQFSHVMATQWSETATGVKSKIDTNKKVIALTFDACGGDGKNGYNEKLISYLESQKIPATLFIGGKWIEANMETFKQLASNSLFEIENHGYDHVPCSISGKSAYGIRGTDSVQGIINEVDLNNQRIQQLTGRKPLFFRPGTAFSDEVCPQIASELGQKVVSYGLLGDAGATYTPEQVKNALLSAKPGSIALLHMNHPEKNTLDGIKAALPLLRDKGFSFVQLKDYPLK